MEKPFCFKVFREFFHSFALKNVRDFSAKLRSNDFFYMFVAVYNLNLHTYFGATNFSSGAISFLNFLPFFLIKNFVGNCNHLPYKNHSLNLRMINPCCLIAIPVGILIMELSKIYRQHQQLKLMKKLLKEEQKADVKKTPMTSKERTRRFRLRAKLRREANRE